MPSDKNAKNPVVAEPGGVQTAPAALSRSGSIMSTRSGEVQLRMNYKFQTSLHDFVYLISVRSVSSHTSRVSKTR